ncbi:MAG: O-antigen ligase family protein [Mariprofundaceae bacterium]
MYKPWLEFRDKLIAATQWMLCASAVSFPFSVAATNIVLGVALASGAISGLLWTGMRNLWEGNRVLALALLGYLNFMFVGLLWSLDQEWGLHILGRQWFWLLVPLAVAALRDPAWSKRFLLALSLGLGLHLLFCAFQMLGWITVTVSGSSVDNATGHIGHIGFGFVYGIWAVWLLYWGWKQKHCLRWGAWILALWSLVTVFLAHGRSGYLITLALLVTMAWKALSSGFRKRYASAALGILVLIIALILFGPARERLLGTWQPLATNKPIEVKPDNLKKPAANSALSTQYRLSLLRGAISAWKKHPILGVGTGGFPEAAAQAKRENPSLNYRVVDYPAHPHNAYLQALVRWGPLGLAMLAFLLYSWIKLGWRLDWKSGEAGPLIALSGIALLIHALSSSSLEDHFSAILAAMLLGAGLAQLYPHDTSESP